MNAAKIRSRGLLLAVLAAWPLLIAQAEAADPASPAKIEIKVFMFNPTSLVVPAGATVTWFNLDQEPHTVVSDTGLFRSGALDTSESFSYRFDKPGTYRFTCSIHPYMVGTITVK